MKYISFHDTFTRVYFCCRNVLQKARELGLRTIALPVINSVRRNYPPDAGAHIALSECISRINELIHSVQLADLIASIYVFTFHNCRNNKKISGAVRRFHNVHRVHPGAVRSRYLRSPSSTLFPKEFSRARQCLLAAAERHWRHGRRTPAS